MATDSSRDPLRSEAAPLTTSTGMAVFSKTAIPSSFDESPEGCARRRIRDLEMQDFRAGRSAAEQNELDNLRTLYPDLPLDPDDPLTEAFEAWRFGIWSRLMAVLQSYNNFPKNRNQPRIGPCKKRK
jgi:hypothetical protein